MAVTEMYSYHPAGGVTAKQVQIACETLDDEYGNCQTWQAEADYAYNSAGQVQSYGSQLWSIGDYNPGHWLPETTYTYTYGAWGKPVSLTDNAGSWSGFGQNTVWAQNAVYDYAGRMTSVQTYGGYQYYDYSDTYAEQFLAKSETWNVNGQMTALNYSSPGWAGYGIQYNYSSSQNNGQITSKTDTGAGVTVTYQYDQLKRLISASSTPNAGATPAAWTEGFTYDGFGNLTSKVLNGATTSIPVNAATNRLTNATYDANGNMWSGAGASITYDAANRMTSATEVFGGTEYYGYAPDNKRIVRLNPNGQMYITLYGAMGEELGVYQNTYALRNNVWFGGQLIGQAIPNYAEMVLTDRLGSLLTQFYPYGESVGAGGVPSTVGTDSLLFATYTRDSWTGLDYADQRMYASSYGRFNTVDPSPQSIDPHRPASWNRYGYVKGDPINRKDPRGLWDGPPGAQDCTDDPDQQGCNDPCEPIASAVIDPSWNVLAFANDAGCGSQPDPDPGSGADSSSPPNCPPGYVPATTPAQLQSIVSTAESYNGHGLTHDNTGHYYAPGGVLQAIDCSGLIAQALAGIGWTATNFQASSVNLTTANIPSLFSQTSVIQVGDIVDFGSHAGIVTDVNAQGQITSFEGSQNSTGPAIYTINQYNSGWLHLSTAKYFTPCVPAGH